VCDGCPERRVALNLRHICAPLPWPGALSSAGSAWVDNERTKRASNSSGAYGSEMAKLAGVTKEEVRRDLEALGIRARGNRPGTIATGGVLTGHRRKLVAGHVAAMDPQAGRTNRQRQEEMPSVRRGEKPY